MALKIDYDKLVSLFDNWNDVPKIWDLLNEMEKNGFEWWDNNLGEYLRQYYNLNISVIYMHISTKIQTFISSETIYEGHGMQFANKEEMSLFVINFM